ncbi:hypothetical protein PhaeoP83_01742 [Phaeobacter inhibens]|uniref:hypothetical protein n=1 Tax=Phaeobacter inhibens TaxID=221822 RepID=UPI00076BB138|nr:hypothetical protein [Phaeobacter inhibens]AUQ50015.1 hypothetical protein PhaeoP83_01742 [Phaeobacter inhibens]AUQ54257.1 hypothetical protein PhaeoP92_01576 [Phaeobacter inhibens]AUQ78273.1 hypothetical protein PhaeoP74_01577 [Phaeobacter inhibens]AUR15432.1 hypothetical protein PhaeoP70_01575 [Phaeobacter inhibens]AUR19820.1 hypothetical protein PhaeoP80_01742 [Phaeobacter inhibens]
MVAPIIWGGIVLGGMYFGSKAIDEAGEAAESAAKLAKWATVAGVVYVSYRALQASGALK